MYQSDKLLIIIIIIIMTCDKRHPYRIIINRLMYVTG